MNVASRAVDHGLDVAVIDNGPLGGTCLNRGCIPSKVMIYPADAIRTIQEARAVGVHARIEKIDFDLIMKRVWHLVLGDRHAMERGVAHTDKLTFYNENASFVSDYTLRIGHEEIRGEKIVIASGSRPIIPPIKGVEKIDYLTSRTLFNIQKPPDSLLIIGGGYIAAEFAHFFSSIGTRVTIIGRNPMLLPKEEPEISELLRRKMSGFMRVYTNHEVVEAGREGRLKRIIAVNRANGRRYKFVGEEVLVATGRRANSDILKPENTGVRTDRRGWILVDPYLRTTKERIWAFGDATGKHMFRHTANYESDVVWRNAFTEHKHQVDEHAIPHAVFTHPQVASVGMTESQAIENHQVFVGKEKYINVAKGYAMAENDGFVKVVVEAGTGKILGCHIIGPEAAVLLQPIVYLMNAGNQTYLPLARAQTIHPSLSEVVVRAFGNLKPVNVRSRQQT